MRNQLHERQDVWQTLKEQTKPIVLYGMGDGADKMLAACARFEIPVRGVFASDAFVRGHTYRGFPVRTLRQTEEQFGDFTALLAFATQRPDVLEGICAVAQRHELLAPDLPVCGDELFTMDYLTARAGDARHAHSLLADDVSRAVFRDLLDYKLSGKPEYLRRCETARAEDYTALLAPGAHEVFVDAGAYNGDTVEEFLRHTNGRCDGVVAVEPDRRNFRKLEAAAADLDPARVRLHNVGVWSGTDTLPFAQRSGRQARLGESGAPTPVDSIDNLLGGARATLLKYDVEGAEREALLGSRETIRRWRPKLIVSAYHRSGDLIDLPLLLAELYPGCRIHLRHNPYLPAWDTDLYVLPPE